MAQKTGIANLPLHYGRVPRWLADRMTKLSAIMSQAIIHHYGQHEFLKRLANPFWFQSFGAVLGMDWHSSGVTTSVIGALKRGLAPLSAELGIYICGGRGKYSRQTPEELTKIGMRVGFNSQELVRSSRLVAKVDNVAVQDGFDLYLHSFIVTNAGDWAVIQQGMDANQKIARRYHWLSLGLKSFIDAPHTAIEGQPRGEIINLTDGRAQLSRNMQIELLKTSSPDRIIEASSKTLDPKDSQLTMPMIKEGQFQLPLLDMPKHHDVKAKDISLRRLHGNIAAAIDRGPKDFAELLLIPKVGARTIFALAQVAEVIHGAPFRFSDPARFSFAHGGKDKQPFPVPIKVYDETIHVLKAAIQQAKLGNDEKMSAIKRLDQQSRALEKHISNGPSVEDIMTHENEVSQFYGGRSVFGFE